LQFENEICEDIQTLKEQQDNLNEVIVD